MSKRFISRTIAISAVIFAFASTPLVGAASSKPNAPGNNGTIKVHEQGTPANTESNDPKVCFFNFEGYGFDKGQGGVIVISSQMNGKDKVGVKQVSMPAADSNGYTETAYVAVPDGHYKTTVYGKDTHGNPDYNQDLKAKSKVIKVKCDTTNDTGSNGGQGSGSVQGTTKTPGIVDSKAATTTRTPVVLSSSKSTPVELPKTGMTVPTAALVTILSAATYLIALKRR